MPDDRFLPGDPREDSITLQDTSPFIAGVHQEAALLRDLINAERYVEAVEVAIILHSRAASLMRDMEIPPLPEVDIANTPDVSKPGRRYKQTR